MAPSSQATAVWAVHTGVAALVLVQDGAARSGGQNFKLYAWADVAGSRLLRDTSRRARPLK